MRPNKIIPVLGYLKLAVTEGGATLSKTNIHSYCQSPVAATGAPGEYLIDESVLKTLLSVTKDDEVKLWEKKGTPMLSDSKNDISFAKEAPANFPQKPPVPLCDFHTLEAEIIDAIFIAKSFLMGGELAAHFGCVHIVSDGDRTMVWGVRFFLHIREHN